MGQPITERELSSFIGTEVFSEADRIRKIPTTWGTRAGVTMPYQEICYLTADCNPDGTPIL